MKLEPLAWGLGVTTGAAIAAFLGGYVPSWGTALAPAAATAVFAVGVYKYPDDATIAWALRVTIAVSFGFVLTTAPLSLSRLAESPEAAAEAADVLFVRGPDEVRQKLTIMWGVMLSMTPVGIIVLVRRLRWLAS